MPKFLIKYSAILLIVPVWILLLSIKANIQSNFTPERVLYGYLILYLGTLLIPNKIVKIIYVYLVYSASVFFSFFEWSYVMLYHERVTTSTIFILFETNAVELSEYLKEYLNSKIIITFFVLVVASFFILKGVKILIIDYNRKEVINSIKKDVVLLFDNTITKKIGLWINAIFNNKLKKGVFGLVLLLVTSVIYVNSNHHKQHMVYLTYSAYQNYKNESESFKRFGEGNFEKVKALNAKSNNAKNIRETYVLIIGESTTKTHLQLYNYYRPTNPELAKLKNELVVFNDVISPHTHTISSLEEVLTLGDYENPNKKFDGTIIDIMKQAGFKTYWITNQIPVGIYETLITTIAKTADKTYFTNLGGELEQQSLDEKVFPSLTEVLKENTNKKFIVVHLLGTHVQYVNRYPEKYDVFKDNPKSIYNTNEALKTINFYDNAVLYNDYIVSSIINLLKKSSSDKKSSVIYLSDHGDDVYETVDMAGHSEAISSKPMYLIPFTYWTNNLEELKKVQQFKDRKYMTDDLIFSIADMANISFNGNEPQRSIFNQNFVERKRIVKDGNDFDQMFH